MNYFERLALDTYTKEFGSKRGMVTLSMWECDYSGHPCRLYGVVSFLVVDDGTRLERTEPASDVLYDESFKPHKGEVLPHVVIFQEI